MFETAPDYRKMVLFLFLFKNGADSLNEGGYSKVDINRLKMNLKIFKGTERRKLGSN